MLGTTRRGQSKERTVCILGRSGINVIGERAGGHQPELHGHDTCAQGIRVVVRERRGAGLR